MRSPLRLPALAIAAVLLLSACGPGASTAPSTAASGAAPSVAAPSTGASTAPSEAAAAPTPEPATDCAQSKDANAMQMWERSGGNKGMVDILVCAWNAANPTKPINLSYIVHTEMVAKIAQGVATGDVPDLMGMDLIYAPQFENANQLVDITDQTKDWPELADVSPGHKTVATFNNRLFGVPLYADVSAQFYRPWQYYHGMRLATEWSVLDKLLFGSDYPVATPQETMDGLFAINKIAESSGLPRIPEDALHAIVNRDYPVLQGVILTVALLVTLVNLVVDALYVVLDPRLRLS